MLRDGVGPGPVGGLEAALLAQQAVQGRVPVDGGRDDQTSGPHRPARLTQCADPVGPLRQVVERSEQQHHVVRAVPGGQGPAVPGTDRYAGQPRRLFQVQRHGIDELGLVPVLGKPLRVHTAAAADVQHACRRHGQEPPEHVLRAPELQAAGALPKAGVLPAEGVVGEDFLTNGACALARPAKNAHSPPNRPKPQPSTVSHRHHAGTERVRTSAPQGVM